MGGKSMAELHDSAGQYTDAEMISMRARMQGFILPSVVRTEQEAEAFETACLYQIEHERRLMALMGNQEIPKGVTGFEIGHFSMTFESGAFSGVLTRKTICDAAYGTLLYAGLLYRGVEGR